MGDRVELRDLSIEASPLLVSRLEPWLGRKLPLDGWLQGNVTVSGTIEALSTTGHVTLVPIGFGGMPSTAGFRGVLHGGADPGFTSFEARVDPLRFQVLSALAPGLSIPGTGLATVSLSGRVDEGVRVSAVLTQGVDSASRVTAHGSVRRLGGARWNVDVRSELAPLSLALLAQIRPDLHLGGSVVGSIHAVGPLDSLRVTGDLTGAGGHLALDGTVDAQALGSRYDLDAKLADVRMSELVGRLPNPTSWSGHVHVAGRGLAPDSVVAVATLEMGGSRLGGLRIDTVAARVRASGGVLGIDTLYADLGGVHVEGAGRLGMVGTREGEARLRFDSDSLIGLRALFMGESVVARDTLSVLEKELLRFQGVNPDALPDSADVAMGGHLRGDARVAGSINSLDVDATVHLRSGVYRLNRVDSATLQVKARGFRSPKSRVQFSLDADGVQATDRRFQTVHVDADLTGGRGEGSVAVRRRPGEVYAATASFFVDSAGGSVDLKEASATFDSLAWRTTRPTRIAWDSSSVTIDSLHITRGGTEPMSVFASGVLSRTGDSDFRFDASGLRLERVARIAQLDSLGVGGRLDLKLRVTGAALTPLIDGSFDLADAQYGDVTLSRIGGTLAYRDEKARVQLEAWDTGTRVLTAAGTIPIELALTHVADRTPDVPMDLHVSVDSLAASVALSYLTVLDHVTGTVSGDFRVGGTLDRPEPSGSLELENAAWSVPAIGVRHTHINGKLTLHPNRTVDVEVATRAVGNSEVTGQVVLEPLSNPTLHLKIHFAGFQAVDRKDVAGRVSGDLALTGTYNRPEVTGKLTVDQGTLSLEEFARSADVVDLTDPDVFNVVDTTVLSSRPFLANLRNPFLDNLRVSIDLSVPRDTWLRSQDMNVEIGTPAGSDLIVTYDRLKRDMVLVGQLDALRGSYTVLGRRFDVVPQSSTVGFIGTPGINPTLNIQAVSRIRRVGADPLSVTATVSGTLTQPRVSLSTPEQAVPQSDLVSYLVFGRPAHELSSGQNALVQGATGAGVTYLTGLAASRFGAAVAQQIGVDYLSISQGGDFQAGNVGILSTALANTQVEIGQYLSQNVFVVVVLRKPTAGASTGGWLGGARVDWALSDNYNAEGFVEDRFLRSQTPGLAELGQNSQIVGVFIYREWGY
jgi:autotransporter translocation and assembly factor TamB